MAVTAALTGLMVTACGESGEPTITATRVTPAAVATVEPTAAPRDAASATSPTARPADQSARGVERSAEGDGPGVRPSGAGFFGGRFGGAGLADAVTAAVAEAAEKSVEEVQSLQESGMTLAEIIEAEGVDREAVVDRAVDQILAGFQGGPAGQAGGARPGSAGAGGGGFGGGAGGAFDPRAALRNVVNAAIDGEAPVAPGGARPFVGMGQMIVNVVAERTGRDPSEVREARAGGQSFASLLFVAGHDVDAAIDAIVETIESNTAVAERPEGAPALPTGEALREAIETIMYATDDSEAELTPPAAQGT
ncbi:MAG: hypothetical protein OXG33_06630 [Chloroflexi bacterium]|nr:hypothetical protein [Chloroflexota bacterium]